MNTTQARVRELLHYEPETGVFTWLVFRGRTAKPGSCAGTINNKGRRMVEVDGVAYSASRLAWLYVTGDWPVLQVDHRNRDKLDDRWDNLRLVTNKQNCENKGLRADNKSGFAGVFYAADRHRWRAKIGHFGRRIDLGSFATKGAAIAAKAQAERANYTHGCQR